MAIPERFRDEGLIIKRIHLFTLITSLDAFRNFKISHFQLKTCSLNDRQTVVGVMMNRENEDVRRILTLYEEIVSFHTLRRPACNRSPS